MASIPGRLLAPRDRFLDASDGGRSAVGAGTGSPPHMRLTTAAGRNGRPTMLRDDRSGLTTAPAGDRHGMSSSPLTMAAGTSVSSGVATRLHADLHERGSRLPAGLRPGAGLPAVATDGYSGQSASVRTEPPRSIVRGLISWILPDSVSEAAPTWAWASRQRADDAEGDRPGRDQKAPGGAGSRPDGFWPRRGRS